MNFPSFSLLPNHHHHHATTSSPPSSSSSSCSTSSSHSCMIVPAQAEDPNGGGGPMMMAAKTLSRRPRLWTTPPLSSRAKRRDDRTSEERSESNKENVSWSLKNMVDPNYMTPVKPNLHQRLSLGAPGVRRSLLPSRESLPLPHYFESEGEDEAEADDLGHLANQVMLMDL